MESARAKGAPSRARSAASVTRAMAGRRTRQGAGAGGQSHALLRAGLVCVSSGDMQREGGLDGALLEDADVSSWQASSVRLSEVALRRVDLGETRLRALSLVDV